MSPECTMAELMAVAIARRLRDGETIAVGSVSPIPASACLLAQATHAPAARPPRRLLRERSPDRPARELQSQRDRRLRAADGAAARGPGQRHPLFRGPAHHPPPPSPPGHSRRVFVPRVDFVTGPGSTPDTVFRLGGLDAVVTDLCVLEFPRERRPLEQGPPPPGVA